MLGIFFVTCLVAGIGYRLRSLTSSGAVLTILTGVGIGYAFGWFGLYVLGVFFSTSSFASKYRSRDKGSVDEIVEKTGARDAIQVLANGGVGLLAALSYSVTSEAVWMYVYIVSIAAATSDTWGSEFGVLAKGRPWSVLRFRRVEAGTSGAVSIYGSVMSFAGATVIVVSTLPFLEMDASTFGMLVLLGVSGSVIDTLLGATVQRKYRCDVCGKVTEKRRHHGQATRVYAGLPYFNNDLVNVLAIACAASLCYIVFR